MTSIHQIAKELTQRVCTHPECKRPHYARDLCKTHYARLMRHGTSHSGGHLGRVPGDPSERFWAKVDVGAPDECWTWRGTVLPKGYGQFRTRDKKLQAHRFAYMDSVGPIPGDLTVDHLCCVKLCMNPAHMELVPGAENTRRRWLRQKGLMA